MKVKIYIFCIIILFSIFSCTPPNPGTHESRITTLLLATNYLMVNSHDNNSQGIKNLVMDVFVDRYAGGSSIEANYKTYRFNINNKDFYYQDRSFEIEVPEEGTYGITVNITSNVCFDNASSAYCNWNRGRIRYRGISSVYNSSSGIPNVININPSYLGSF